MPNNNQNSPVQSQPHADASWSPVADAMRGDYVIPKTKQGNLIDPADPGSSGSRLITLLFTVLIVGLVVLWQNTNDDLKYDYLLHKAPPVAQPKADLSAPGSFGQVDLMGRVYIRGFEILKAQPIMSQIDPPGAIYTDEDELRLVMLAGEFGDSESALLRLDDLREKMIEEEANRQANENPDQRSADEKSTQLILAEIDTLEALYVDGAQALDDTQRDQITNRYGLIGRFALTHGLEDDDPARQPLISGGLPLVGFGFALLLGVIFVPLVGMCLLILGIVFLAIGKIKFHSHVPTKGGSVFLETYALFVGGFLIMSVAAFFVVNSKRPELASLALLAQWLLLLFVFWGLVRRMNFHTWRKAIGWHAGQGVLKEIGIGIIAYLASIPIYIVGVLITMIVMIVSESIKLFRNNGIPEEPESITNPIFEMLAQGDLIQTLILFSLVTIWAPIVEETIFRGALFRHLRGSMHWFLAALFSAILFAYMHNYGPLMVAPLIALGFMFAFMREWRGSLIAPMTAHFLHNFTLMSVMLIIVQLIKDPM